MPEAETPVALKEIFNEAHYRVLSDLVKSVHPGFPQSRFLSLTLSGLEDRSLLQRLRRTSEALRATLPDDYLEALEILRAVAQRVPPGFATLVFPDFVGVYGTGHYDESLAALRFFTCMGSAEFAIREFLKLDLTRTIALMQRWAEDENEHVRRLASEGCRPRLPWSFRLQAVVENPHLTLPILERLMDDPSLYVRKSVANHLNDISKDHPQLVIDWLQRQNLQRPRTAWIARRALRTLVKQGNPAALALVGVKGKARFDGLSFKVTPKRVRLGSTVTLACALRSDGTNSQRWVIDFSVHYVKSTGGTSAKVFKWKTLTIEPGAKLTLRKVLRLQDFTTRKHYAGLHRVELLINGVSAAEGNFELIGTRA